MSSSKIGIDDLTKRPKDNFGRFLYNLAYILALFGGMTLVIVILINVISILNRIIFLNPLVGDFELVEIGSAIAISSFLPLCHLKKGNVIVDFITSKLNLRKIAFLDCTSSIVYGLIATFFTYRMYFGARDMLYYQEETMLLQFPIWIPFLPVTLSFGLLSICCFYTFYSELKISRG